MGLAWGEAEMAALDRTVWRPHAPCGAKSKKKYAVEFKEDKLELKDHDEFSIKIQIKEDSLIENEIDWFKF